MKYWHIFREQQIGVIFMGVNANIKLLWDVIFRFKYSTLKPFLTDIVNKTYTGFYTFKMFSGKRPK